MWPVYPSSPMENKHQYHSCFQQSVQQPPIFLPYFLYNDHKFVITVILQRLFLKSSTIELKSTVYLSLYTHKTTNFTVYLTDTDTDKSNIQK